MYHGKHNPDFSVEKFTKNDQ